MGHFHFQIAVILFEWQVAGGDGFLPQPSHEIREEMLLREEGAINVFAQINHRQ